LAVRSHQQHAELVGDGDQLALADAACLAGLAVAGAGDEGRPHSLRGAGAQQHHVGAVGRAHEDQIGDAVGNLAHVAHGRAAQDVAALAVHGEDLTVVAEAQQVVQRHEAEFAGVRRGAGDDDAARVEQRLEALLQLALGAERWARRRQRARGRAGGRQLDQRIDRHRRPRAHDQRIDVDARDIRSLGGQAPQAHQQCAEDRLVQRRLAAEGLEQQLAGPQAPQHAPCLGRVERRRRKDHVAEGLGENATETEHHTGAEQRIAHDAGDELAVPPHHLGHQQPDLAVLGNGAREQVFGRGLHGRGVGQSEAHQVALGLVRDAVAAELDRHGKA
jgi:hypothetical protein